MFNSKKASVLKRRRLQQKAIGSLILIVLIFSVSFVMGRKEIRQSVAHAFHQSAIAVYNVVSTVSFAPIKWVRAQLVFVDEIYRVHENNSQLKKEIETLSSYHTMAQSLHAENQALKKQLFYVNALPQAYLTAKISRDSSTPFSRSIFVHAGLQDGVQKYAPVLANGYLLGQVVDVYENISRVLLITDTSIKIPVLTSKTRRRFFLSGDGQSKSFLIYPEDKIQIESQELVVTSGFGNIFPADLLVGRVTEIGKRLEVAPFISIQEIEWVQVLKLHAPIEGKVVE
ncbi:MAG: rod shape-determining protein MreC [Alphaproteobacteria bacterium]|nr:rod shape-determining protein MreC [Alphaproteobacteria bacterium]MBN2779607.1 rod shape-determining protein MreC [Alphaproteobacteria bacterium]